MKKTILLLTILVSIAIFSGTFSGNASAGIKAADDCCMNFKVVDIDGNPATGCMVSVYDMGNNFIGNCVIEGEYGCDICGMEKGREYRVEVSCNCIGPAPGTFICNGTGIIIVGCTN